MRACFIVLLAFSCGVSSQRSARPIIGILSVPLGSDGCVTFANSNVKSRVNDGSLLSPTSCFHNLYVQWVESAGARVVPIPYDAPQARLDTLFKSVNGLLFTGGETMIKNLTSPYMTTANYLLKKVVEANDKGTHFPLWGTCMGIQTLSVLVSQDPAVVLSNAFDSDNGLMLPLDMTSASKKSRLFGTLGSISPPILNWFETKDVTTNLHHDGVLPDSFHSNERLSSFFNVLSTNQDRKGKTFVSTIEGKKYPIYGVQWHPERPQFEWGVDGVTKDPINHDAEAISCMQYTSNFFVSESRKNNHSFGTVVEEQTSLIYNYVAHGDTYYQVYLF
jgi:gamma-glutamyl hydrolase